MNNSSVQIQVWLKRLQAGDAHAREKLINHSCERLRRLTRKMLHGDRLHRWEQTDDVLQDALLKLHQALKKVRPKSPRDFIRLAALKIRQALVDLARRDFGPQGVGAHYSSDAPAAGADSRTLPRHTAIDPLHNPEQLAAWNDAVEALPDELREAFDLIFYYGHKHAEAAAIAGVSVKTMQRRWVEARTRIHATLYGDSTDK